MKGQRLRREDPVRTEPIRNFSNAFRTDPWEDPDRYGTGDPCGPGPAGDAGRYRDRASWNDVVSRGVELGYQVIEDQIRQGQRVARDLNDRPYDVGRMSDDLWEVTERSFRYYSEATNLWMQFLTGMSWMGGPGMGGPWTRPWGRPGDRRRPEEAASAPSPAESGWRRVAVAFEVDSLRPVSVELDLHTPGDVALPLAAVGLQSLEGHTALTEITFEPGVVREGVRLRLRIPDDQPAGFYTGVVFDQRTGQSQGTLSVRVSERVERVERD